MDIDLSQFSQVFFEESLEGLDIMESELLAISLDSPDAETINTIFRSAHSIKGGSATFGFTQVANFTHLLETLLDEIRDSKRQFNQQHQDMLLRSVDVLKEMLDALMLETDLDETELDQLTTELTLELEKNSDEHAPLDQVTTQSPVSSAPSNDAPLPQANLTESPDTNTIENIVQEKGTLWNIEFKAGEDILRYGNHPNLMFTELKQLGTLHIKLTNTHAPDFEELDPESCYLHWSLQLHSEMELSRIKEVFEWVEDECDISYQEICDDTCSDKPSSMDTSDDDSAIQALSTQVNVQPDTTQLANLSRDSADKNQAEPIKDELSPPPTGTELKKISSTKKHPAKVAEQGSIRVSIEKIDMLINMVGELVITQAMLGQIGDQETIDDNAKMDLQQGLEQLASHTRDLQESVMQIRMLPISFAFNRFPRLVRDISQQLGKQVELTMKGEDTELDKTVMEKIVDPMVHLVRNSLDHGLETPEMRSAKGKPAIGSITLNAYHQGGNIIIEIIDDGAGLNTQKILEKAKEKGLIPMDEHLSDEAIHQLIFHPGFSTADAVSDLSGRGVGMDVVKRNIQELNGTIELSSQQDQGSRVTIRLPLTLAILDGQLVRVGKHTYVVPLVSIYESLQVKPEKINRLSDGNEVFHLRDDYLPIIKIFQQFSMFFAN